MCTFMLQGFTWNPIRKTHASLCTLIQFFRLLRYPKQKTKIVQITPELMEKGRSWQLDGIWCCLSWFNKEKLWPKDHLSNHFLQSTKLCGHELAMTMVHSEIARLDRSIWPQILAPVFRIEMGHFCPHNPLLTPCSHEKESGSQTIKHTACVFVHSLTILRRKNCNKSTITIWWLDLQLSTL